MTSDSDMFVHGCDIVRINKNAPFGFMQTGTGALYTLPTPKKECCDRPNTGALPGVL